MSADIVKILKLSKIFETASVRILAAKEKSNVELERDKFISKADGLILHFEQINKWLNEYKRALLDYKLKNKNAKINDIISEHFLKDNGILERMINTLRAKTVALGAISSSLSTVDVANISKMQEYRKKIIEIHSKAEEWMDQFWSFYLEKKPTDMTVNDPPKVPEL